ncbi:MAG: hypothetical protein R2741_00180 [Methanolobus sp.]
MQLETEKVNAARSLYEWVEKEASIPIEVVKSLFITRVPTIFYLIVRE